MTWPVPALAAADAAAGRDRDITRLLAHDDDTVFTLVQQRHHHNGSAIEDMLIVNVDAPNLLLGFRHGQAEDVDRGHLRKADLAVYRDRYREANTGGQAILVGTVDLRSKTVGRCLAGPSPSTPGM